MSDDTTPTPTPADVAPPAQAVDAPEPEQKVDEVDWKAKAREWERRAKENKSAADKLAEIEEANKTEAQKAADRLAAAEKAASAAESRALRLDVAFEKGLTPAQAKRLVGSTREELEADADEILRDFPVKGGRPTGDIAQGARTTALPADPRARDLAQIDQDLKAGARR